MAADEVAGWYRVGGHRLQFYATDAEIAEWLQEMLPPESAPYSIVGREWQEGRWQPFTWPMSGRAADAHSRGEVTFTANPGGLRS